VLQFGLSGLFSWFSMFGLLKELKRPDVLKKPGDAVAPYAFRLTPNVF
jgi:hypothetical protein